MSENPLVPKEETPMTPGIGVAGMTMCPFGFQRSPCLKQGCELWVELSYGQRKVARCSLAWGPVIQTELRAEVEKLRDALTQVNQEVKDDVKNPSKRRAASPDR